jgi:hypothetical protein
MKTFILLVTTILLLQHSLCNTFCSVVCGRRTCTNNNILPTGCTGCNTNWILVGNTCQPNAASNYKYLDTTSDLGGTLTVAPISTYSPQCNIYSLFGLVTPADTVTVSSATGIAQPFFQMIIYFGIFSIDSGGGSNTYWNGNTHFFLRFTGGSASPITNSYKKTGATYVVKNFLCGRSSIS